MKGKNATKEVKKLSDPNAKKSQSSYQTGKTTVSKLDITPSKKK